MRQKHAIAILAMLLSIATASPFAMAQGIPGETATPALGIRSQAELDDYLKVHAGQATPFDALSAGALERFFMSLEWGRNGVGSLDGANLSDDGLDREQVRAILALFGQDMIVYADTIKSRPQSVAMRANRNSIDNFERRYNRFYRKLSASYGDADAMKATVRAFDASFPEITNPDSLDRLADHDLVLLVRAISTIVSDASPDERHVDALRNVVMELDHRGLAGTGDLQRLRDALLIAHRYAEARRVGEAHPAAGLPPLPAFQDRLGDAPGPSFWRMGDDGATLTRTAFDPSGTRILVTAGCHFSQDAAQDISADPVLGPVFAAHALWLVLAPGMEDIEAVRDWNRRFLKAPAVMIHDRAEWSLLPPGWTMPHFFIIRDGKVVDSDTGGWSRDSMAEN